MKSLFTYSTHTIQKVLSEFNRYYGSFFGDLLRSPNERILFYSPAVDIQETDYHYVMKMELPGFNKENIEIIFDGVYISIVSKPERKKYEKGEADKKYIRSFLLPIDADPQTVDAIFKDGILSLIIKKRGKSQKQVIEIKAA